MAVQVPSHILAALQGIDRELWPALIALAYYESTWREDAEGDFKLYWGGPIVSRDTPGAFPTSFGLLQYHVDGGLGTGMDPGALKHGPTIMRLGAEYIRGRLASGVSLWDALSPWSTRSQAWELMQRIGAEGIEGVSGGVGAAPAGEQGVTAGGLLMLAIAAFVVLEVA